MASEQNINIDYKKVSQGPATVNDKFIFNAVSMKEIIKEKENKKETVILNHIKRPILSTDLAEGMIIKAENNQKEVTKIEKSR